MKRNLGIFGKLVAGIHFGWGVLLLLLAFSFALAPFEVLPEMAPATIWTNSFAAIIAGAGGLVILGVPGMVILALGRRVWRLQPGLRSELLWVHGFMLVPEAALLIWAVLDWYLAASRVAQGEGPLGAFNWLPLGLGAGLLAVSLLGIAFALKYPSRQRRG